MTTLTEVRRALAATLEGIAPTVKVATGDSGYDEPTQKFIVRVLVGPPSDESEEALDVLLAPEGSGSVKEALEANHTLGGLVNDLHVAKHTGYQLYAVPGAEPQLGAQWTVGIIV